LLRCETAMRICITVARLRLFASLNIDSHCILAALNPGRTKVSHECVSVDLDPCAALQRRKQLIVRGERIGLHKAYENRTVFVREFQRASRYRHQRHFQFVDGLDILPYFVNTL
jgi:hypothetical protein